MPDRPNILVLMSDQHRADAMGCSGNPDVSTPNLDRLAAEGTSFRRAYCQGPLCAPSRVSFLTERYVRDHGVMDNNREVDESMPTFLHSLQRAGYHTACFGKMHLYVQAGIRDVKPQLPRMQQLGFDESHETGGKGASVRMRSEFTEWLEANELFESYRQHFVGMRGQPAWATIPFPLPLEAYPDYWMGGQVARWIETYNRESPFMMWVGFPGPHSPWDAPADWVDRYAATSPRTGSTARPQESASEAYNRFIGPRLRDSDSDTLTPERADAVRRAYLANVSLIDESIGLVIAALERRGELENTVIVYTTDHGEMLGDHGLLAKRVFYEPSVRVPLIIRAPSVASGVVREDIVQMVDIPATLRDFAGGEPVTDGVGRSLLDGPARQVAYSENLGFAMAVTDRWKVVAHEETGEAVALFDLWTDPLEDRNVVAEPSLRSILDALMANEMAELLSRPATLRPDARPEGRGGHDD
jgi:arylsulfatase